MALRPDYDNLLVEWEEIPNSIDKAGRKAADARLDFDTAKADFEYTEALLTKRVTANRKNKFKMEKGTAQEITATVRMQPEYLQKEKRLFMARHEMNLAESRSTAYEAKRKSLENLMQFFLRGWGGTDMKISNVVGGDAAQINDAIKEMITRRKMAGMKTFKPKRKKKK